MKVLVTGADGQLGHDLVIELEKRGHTAIPTDRNEMDITDAEAVERVITDAAPDAVIHCAAYTAVDKAEEDVEVCRNINAQGTRNIAASCNRLGCKLMYISTDYVFDGTKTGEYEVDDPTNPKNEYGKAKLAGEKAIQAAMTDYYIIRTSWVFGEYGKNFVYTMLRLAKDHDRLTVVNDQIGRPTWTRTLAEFMTYLVDHHCEYGVYQLSNEDSCSWYEFAREILKDKDVEVAPVTSEEYPQKAYRPRHSIMSLNKAEATGFTIPTWQASLYEFLVRNKE